MGRPKKILSTIEADSVSVVTIPEQEIKIEDIKKENQDAISQPEQKKKDVKIEASTTEFEQNGKKYRKTFNAKGDSLGAVEVQ